MLPGLTLNTLLFSVWFRLRGEVHSDLPVLCQRPGRDRPGERDDRGGDPEEPGGLVEDQGKPRDLPGVMNVSE